MTLDFSAYPNADDATKARTEEFFALVQNHEATDAKLLKLLQEGMYLEAREPSGRTALELAAYHSLTKTVQALLAAGAKIEARDKVGNTALTWAACGGRAEVVRALLAAGANIEARNKRGETALIWAASNGESNIVRELIDAGANIEARDNNGETALQLASNTNTMGVSLNAAELRASYDDFVANGTAPKSAAEVYHLLAVTPLVDPRATVNFVGNIRKIFAHAQWADKEQAAEVLSQMQDNGRINAETVDSILHATFPERLHVAHLQRHNSGIAL